MPVTITRNRLRRGVLTPENLARKMNAIDQLKLTVGIQGARAAKRYKSGLNVATVGAFHEFGTSRAPQRSFLRATIKENSARIQAFIAQEMETYVVQPKRSARDTMVRIGGFVAKMVRQRINTTSHWAVRNAPSTVAAKGFDRPLHETELLEKSISWAVRTKAGAIISEGGARR